MSDWRDHAERQRGGNRPRRLCGLWLLRRGLPTGAASYALPAADVLMRRLRTLVQAYRKAGGTDAVVLLHDGDHGEPLIDTLARFGDGLPANVLPVRVNEVTQVGPEAIAALFAFGAAGIALLTRAKPSHDPVGLRRVVETSGTIVAALGFGDGLVRIIQTDDPDQLRAMLDAAPVGIATQKPATLFPPLSQISNLSLMSWHLSPARHSAVCC